MIAIALRARVGVVAWCIAVASACGDRGRLPPDTVERFLQRRDGVVSVLAGDGVGPDTVIGDIIDAQWEPGAVRVWIVDRYPPFVRIIEPSGRLVSAFLKLGDGPLEARRPNSIAVTRSAVAVLHASGLNLYDLHGGVLRTHVHLPIGAEGVGAGCGGDWLLYGRSGTPFDSAHKAGVYSVHIGSDTVLLTVLKKDTVGNPYNQLVRRFYAADDQRYVYDIRGTPRTILRMSCGTVGLSAVAEMPAENVATEIRRSGTKVRFSATLNAKTAILNGFAVLNGSVIATFLAEGGSGKIALFDPSGRQYWVRTHTSHRLLDVENRAALFALADPAPTLLRANVDTLVEFLRRSGVADVAVR